jgi:hypothetical protein
MVPPAAGTDYGSGGVLHGCIRDLAAMRKRTGAGELGAAFAAHASYRPRTSYLVRFWRPP